MGSETKKLFQITEAAHACGISRSTLLRMEEKGLLKPAYTAPESGRRYYDNYNIARILQVEKFKAMGLSPEDIADYFLRRSRSSFRTGKAVAHFTAQRRGNAAAHRTNHRHFRAVNDAARSDLPDAAVYGRHHCGKIRLYVRFLWRVRPKGLCSL